MSTSIDNGETGRRTARAAIGAALALSLCACNPLTSFAPTETELLQAGFVAPERLPPPRPVFCYRTLAAADCHGTPAAGEGHRLVGAYAPGYLPID